MKVIDPKPITLVSSNVPEDDAPLWSDTATYALGAQVIRPNHRLYEALRAVAAGETPETHTAGDNPAWSDKGSTNRHRMFDVYASRQTTHNGPMLVELDASKCNSIALWNIQGATLALTLTSGGQTVWSLPPQSLLLPSGNSYFSWFFGERDYRRNHYVQFPLYVSATLGIEIGGTATACGDGTAPGASWRTCASAQSARMRASTGASVSARA